MTVLSLGDEIGTYLAAAGIGLTQGTNLFVSLMPDLPSACVAIIETGGMPPVMTLTGTSGVESKLDRPTFQVRSRADVDGYVAGQTLMQTIYGKLQGVTETKINGASFQLFHLIAALQPPVYLGRDAKERHEWSQNYSCFLENGAR